MEGPDRDRTDAGFREPAPLSEAREILREAVSDLERPDPERIGLGEADGRVLAQSVRSRRDVPHYERAATDGWAVRAADTDGASSRSPAVLRIAGESGDRGGGRVESGTAVRVHTGSALPDGADAVVKIERVAELEPTDELEVLEAVAEGENVAPVGEDVEAGHPLYEAGHRLRPSDLGLLKPAGYARVAVAPRPTVGVVPTGEELVQADPAAGEVLETNGLTVSQLVERWGGRATYRNVVADDPAALRAAIQRDLTKDVVVTTGGSSVGERDYLPEVIDELGEVLVHGVALKPGHPICLGLVEGTPVLALPGYPVACLVNAVQFLRPVLRWLEGTEPEPHPTTRARLDRKIASEPGIRTFARVRLERRDDGRGGRAGNGSAYSAVPTRARGAGVLSSVALADGWVVVEESREGIPAGETVAVENWEP